MTPNLLANITSYKDYFLVISGAYGNRVLTVLDKELQIISECDFAGIQMWEEDFHIDEATSQILISVTITDTFPLESNSYQGFHTLWYELTETSSGFHLQQIDKWEQSDIRRIKSKIYQGERIWVCLRDLNFISQIVHRGKRSIIGTAQTAELEIPKFDYSASIEHSHLSHFFDFEVTSSDILLSGIGNIPGNLPTLIRISRNRKNMEFFELDIPLKKLHDFRDTVIRKVNDQLFAYFWITSSGSCKKYVFELYSVEIRDLLSQSTFSKAIDSENAHSFQWNNNGKVAYRTGDGDTPCLIGRIGENGEITEIRELEIASPILFSDSDEILALVDERKRMIKIATGHNL